MPNNPEDKNIVEGSKSELDDNDSKYRLIFDNALEGIMIMQEGRVIFGNPMLSKITGYTLEELNSQIVTNFVHPEDRAMVHDRYSRRLLGEDVIPEYSFRLITKEGETKWIYIKVTCVNWDGKPATLSFLSDITDRKSLEDELRKLSQQDELTNIANRRAFNAKLQNEWRRALRSQIPISVIMIDIDNFKKYNDHYGHPAGDECLKLIAEVLGKMIGRPSDLIARYGGEEFVVVLQSTSKDGARELAEHMCRKIESLQIQHLHPDINGIITISVGVSTVIPDTEMNPDKLLDAADKALYIAKKAGKNQVCTQPVDL